MTSKLIHLMESLILIQLIKQYHIKGAYVFVCIRVTITFRLAEDLGKGVHVDKDFLLHDDK